MEDTFRKGSQRPLVHLHSDALSGRTTRMVSLSQGFALVSAEIGSSMTCLLYTSDAADDTPC
eukprot:4912028-Amphidinium_carterae.1